ncbi:hybrid sensor histidine kinase/response regulator [Synechococcus sp. PCC 7336]|uniref:hybrid sensor histidine kinase/response regulator n=1 Tax=Synechococcus sp. PCC 7336 TaxID=195250 RepID=UPI00034D3A31|nr:hybrid sensor histidine kinase/response regulator [Synechococcus sp. PCC 7336]
MSVDATEREVKLRFLEEVQEFFNTIEAALLELSRGDRDRHLLDSLRAAHSVKGGAAMMGFHTLSSIAHRFEDSLKALKARGPDVAIERPLERLLLAGLDSMRQVATHNRQMEGEESPPAWLDEQVEPVLQMLREILGDPTPEDEAALLSESEGRDMTAVMFDTEVGSCLERLEQVLADPESPCLLPEFAILAEELEGLGEMLQLGAFSRLCGSVAQQLAAAESDRVVDVATAALQAWKRSRALVLAGQTQLLPDCLQVEPAPATTAPPPSEKLFSPPLQSEGQIERTVRVDSDRLEELNNLFGEFTIERNALALHLHRVQNLFSNLKQRVQTLEQSRRQLRTDYDQHSAAPTHLTEIPFPLASSDSDSPSLAALSQNEFDELEMDCYTDLHSVSQELMETIVQVEEIAADIDLGFQAADRASSDMDRTSKLLQANLSQLRMRPFRELVSRFPRTVRDLCSEYGKEVDLVVRGSSILFERAVLESLRDPLMHLLRNAFDHGIEDPATRLAQGKPERGTIQIQAQLLAKRTVITIRDDGQGIDPAKIRARLLELGYGAEEVERASRAELLDRIFEPGFSTADRVTELSGRGIGMDVARSNLTRMRGSISVDTELGVGTSFTLEVPLTLSHLRVLMAESDGMPIAFPLEAIEEILLLDRIPTIELDGTPALCWQDRTLPVIQMGAFMRFQHPHLPVELETAPILTVPAVLVMLQGKDAIAVQIDRHWGEREIVVRQVEGSLPLPYGFSGCTILGDGQVVPLADVAVLFQLACGTSAVLSSSSLSASAPLQTESKVVEPKSPPSEKPVAPQAKTILVVDDSTNVRRFLALTLAKAGFDPEQAKDGREALEKLRSGLAVAAVICDIEMPRLDGFGFLARVQADPHLAQLPVVMLTSRSGDKHRRLAMELGASAYFTKPYREVELLQKLRQLTGDRQSLAAPQGDCLSIEGKS